MKISMDYATSLTIPMFFGLIGIAEPFSLLFFGSDFNGIENVLSLISPVIFLQALILFSGCSI